MKKITFLLTMFLLSGIAHQVVANEEASTPTTEQDAPKTVTRRQIRHRIEAAIREHNLDSVKFLVEKYTVNLNKTDELGKTPLVYACEVSSIPIAEYLISQGANVEFDKNTNEEYYTQRSLLAVKRVPRNLCTTALYLTCKNGNLKMTQFLVEKGANMFKAIEIDKYYSPLETPFYVAVRLKQDSIVQYACDSLQALETSCGFKSSAGLISKGYDDEETESRKLYKGWSTALNATDSSVLKILFKHGLDPNFKTQERYPPAIPLVFEHLQDVNTLQIFFDHGLVFTEPTSNYYWKRNETGIILLKAVENNAPLATIKYLIEKGAPLSTNEKTPSAPLLAAINKNANLETIRYFVEELAMPTETWMISDDGEKEKTTDALAEACRSADSSIVSYFLNREIEKAKTTNTTEIFQNRQLIHNLLVNNLLFNNVRYGNPEIIVIKTEIIERDMNLIINENIPDTSKPPFFEFINIIASQEGFDINEIDLSNRTAFQIACMKFPKNREIIQWFIDKEAMINLIDDETTPLGRLVQNDADTALIDLLIQHGAELNLNVKRPPLHAACAGAHFYYYSPRSYRRNSTDARPIVKYLIEKGADVNYLDADGRTPIFYAVMNNDEDLIKFLIDHDAKLDIQAKVDPINLTDGTESQTVLELLRVYPLRKGLPSLEDESTNKLTPEEMERSAEDWEF